MAVESLINKYSLQRKAEGLSPKTIAHTKMSVRFFAEFLGGIDDVSKVTADELRRFVIALQGKERWTDHPYIKTKGEISGTSINTYVRATKSFWSWLLRERIIKKNPLASVPAPKIPKRLPKVLSEDELIDVLKAARSDRDKAILSVLLDTGIRLSELAGLKKQNYDEKTGIVTVIGKGDKQRHVFVSEEAVCDIGVYWAFERANSTSDALFLTEDGRPLTASRIQKILERIGKKAGIKRRLSPHKLRHSYATVSLKNGANLDYVRRTLGHTDIATTEVYLELTDADVQQAHKKFSPIANLRNN